MRLIDLAGCINTAQIDGDTRLIDRVRSSLGQIDFELSQLLRAEEAKGARSWNGEWTDFNYEAFERYCYAGSWRESPRARPAGRPASDASAKARARLADIALSPANVDVRELYRRAQANAHPDRPDGTAELFKEVTALGQELGVADSAGRCRAADE